MTKTTFNKDYLAALNKHPQFSEATTAQVAKGQQLSELVNEGDRPEDYLSEADLYCLSAFYEYQAIERQADLLSVDDDEYPWPEEELALQED
jgi:hypothetical protein